MESVNETFEKAIEFISVIQTICEDRRSQVEKFSLKYYTAYLKDKKEEQKKTKVKEFQKNIEPKNSVTEVEKPDSLEIDGLEELALADSLLQRAQNIRSQSKVSSQLLTVHASSSSESLLCNDKHKTSALKKNMKEDCAKNHAALPRCNSAPNAFKSKLSRGLQSKSLNDFKSKKEACVLSSYSNSRKCFSAQNSNSQKKSRLNPNVGYISSTNFKDLKTVTVHSSLSKHKESNNSITKGADSSDSSENPHHLPSLTYQSFRQDLTKKCCLESNFQLPSCGFWYPFISLKNKETLTDWSKCNCVENFITAVNVMFEIQEIMMWIDLLTFLGDEIFPSLRFMKKSEKNVVRLCSYLSSIYHESLQRIPMLDSD